MEFERKIDLKLILSIIAAALMSFIGILEGSAMNIAFTTLMKDFNVGTSSVQWITTSYILVLTIMIPASTYLNRRFKMKSVFIIANLSFLFGTLLCYFSPSFPILITGRFIQGMGSGLVIPLMFNIILEQAPINKAGFIVGIASIISASAPAVGPIYGGFMINYFGWRMIFLPLVPITIISFVFGAYAIRQVSPLKKPRFDLLGFTVVGASFVCFIIGFNLAGAMGWTDLRTIGLLLAGVVLICLFVKHERTIEKPLINMNVFKYKGFSFGICSMLCCGIMGQGVNFLLPYFSQNVRGLDALSSAYIMILGTAAGAIINPIAGSYLDRHGPRLTLTAGPVLAILGTSLLAVSFKSGPIWAIMLCFAVYMLAHGICLSNNIPYGLKCLPPEIHADGNAVINVVQNLSAGLGVVLATTIVAGAQTSGGDMASETLTGSLRAVIFLCAMAVMLLILEMQVVKTAKKRRR